MLGTGDLAITRRLQLHLRRLAAGTAPVPAPPAAVARWLRQALGGEAGETAAAIAIEKASSAVGPPSSLFPRRCSPAHAPGCG